MPFDGMPGAPEVTEPMSPYDSAPRLDAPTIAFDHQPTASIDGRLLARALQDSATTSPTLRPVDLPARSMVTEVTVVGRGRRRGGVWLCVVGLAIGVMAGHLVREGRGYASAASAAVNDALGRGSVRAREARASEVVVAHAAAALRGKDPGAPARPKTTGVRGARKGAVAAGVAQPASATTALDALYVDYEPSFRAPR
ncbi:MAG: hypothetical protein JST00_29895 [Deltaproteobacteria bacterium]|nr:hypothetical protein [Deltaproteobacteria bacterium]